jgi:hypothetical protein
MSPTQQKPPEEFSDDFHGNDDGRQARLRRLVQQSPKDRIQAMNERVNEPAKCEYCGSTWFAELTFNQYSAGAYSAAPGGDIQPISLMPMPIRVCLCSMPMAPNLGGASLGGRTPNESVSNFNGSLRVAAAKILARAGVAPPPSAAAAVSVEEVQQLLRRIAMLEKTMSEVRATATAPPPPKPLRANKVTAGAKATPALPDPAAAPVVKE